jgi:hypothetical protein
VVAQSVTSPDRLRTGGRHRKQALHRKEPAGQRFSVGRAIIDSAITAVIVILLALAGLVASWDVANSPSIVDAYARPTAVPQAPMTTPRSAPLVDTPPRQPPRPFPADDKGFLDSSARCAGAQPAYAIGRTKGSLVVICGEQGRFEYLGVRLSDAAVLRADAQTSPAPGYLARKSGVVYAVSPTELKVTTGGTVIKREAMIEYREVPR